MPWLFGILYCVHLAQLGFCILVLVLYLPAPRLKQGDNTFVVLELHGGPSTNTSADGDGDSASDSQSESDSETDGDVDANATVQLELVGQPMLRLPPKPPPSLKCDPGAPAKSGAPVRMVTENPKYAHQQQWTHNTTTGLIALRSDPSLCISVRPGCPDHTTGCVFLSECSQAQPPYGATGFDTKQVSGGHTNFVSRQDSKCLEIDGHDNFEGAPLGVWACGGEYEQANEWWKYDEQMGHLASEQAGAQPGPFVATVCTTAPAALLR